MRNTAIKTKLFLDSGDPSETKRIIEKLGFLDGQTTNPSLVAKNPEAIQRAGDGDKFSSDELLFFYRGVVEEISKMIPKGSVSIEVYADRHTGCKEMVLQGREMFSWIPNAHIKLPITKAGLEAAESLVKEGVRINMTLCFSEQQAAAVYAATRGAERGQVFISPFIGRLDDIGMNGVTLLENILDLYSAGDGHVEVLAASIRGPEHLSRALQIGADILTVPFAILSAWGGSGAQPPGDDFVYAPEGLTTIAKESLDLEALWQSFDISHELTDKGLDRFAADWNSLIHTT